jgi:hypothetical protein
MAGKTISELNVANILNGNEYIPLIKDGSTYRSDLNTITNFIQNNLEALTYTQYFDEGVAIGSVSAVDFVGDGVSAAYNSLSTKLTITVPRPKQELYKDGTAKNDVIGINFVGDNITKTYNPSNEIATVEFSNELPESENGQVLYYDNGWKSISPNIFIKQRAKIRESAIEDISYFSIGSGLSASLSEEGELHIFRVNESSDTIVLSGDFQGEGINEINGTVIALRGYPLDEAEPTDGQVMMWNAALTAWTPTSSTVTLTGDIKVTGSGPVLSSTVTKIQGVSVVSTPPTNNQTFKYNSSTNRFEFVPFPTSVSVNDVVDQIKTYKSDVNIVQNVPAIIEVGLLTNNFYYYQLAATGDYIINVSATSSQALSSTLPIGKSMDLSLVLNMVAGRNLTDFNIDGVKMDIKWKDATVASTDNLTAYPNSYNLYEFKIIRSGSGATANDYLVLGSISKYV